VNWQCACSNSGYCPVLGRHMTSRQHTICQQKALTPDKCLIYIEHWLWLKPGIKVPGYELKYLLQTLRLVPTETCNCEEMITKMNRWGVEGCKTHRKEIVDHLEKSYSALTWTEVVKAAANTVITGLVSRLNPLDLAGSLADEAVHRCELGSIEPNSK